MLERCRMINDSTTPECKSTEVGQPADIIFYVELLLRVRSPEWLISYCLVTFLRLERVIEFFLQRTLFFVVTICEHLLYCGARSCTFCSSGHWQINRLGSKRCEMRLLVINHSFDATLELTWITQKHLCQIEVFTVELLLVVSSKQLTFFLSNIFFSSQALKIPILKARCWLCWNLYFCILL